MGIIIFIAVLLVLILVHEFGHFIVAKKFGIRVDEFGFGFPPKVFGKKFGETEYSMNLIPIGGFVKIYGENPEELAKDDDYPDKERCFVNKPKYVQALVLIAGVAFNILLAWLLFAAVFMIGTPAFADNDLPRGGTVEDVRLTFFGVAPNTPAYDAGLRANDKLLGVAAGEEVLSDEGVENIEQYIAMWGEFLERHQREGIDVTYVRGDNEPETVNIVPIEGLAPDKLAIGVGIDYVGTLRVAPQWVFWHAAKTTIEYTGLIAQGMANFFKKVFTGEADFQEVAGPVGIAGVVGEVSSTGISALLTLVAIISINLAILNLLPVPALDGGRLLFLLIEVIKGSPIKPQIAGAVNAVGFVLLLILMAIVTYNDIIKLLI